MSEIPLSCDNCVYFPLCRFYIEEMERKFGATFKGNLIMSLKDLKRDMAEECHYYLEKVVRIDG